MKVKISVRFPNEDYSDKMFIDTSMFIPEKMFRNRNDKEVFGWYDGTFIAVKIEDYEEKFLIKQKPTTMKREDVYKALDSERDYQDEMSKSALRPDMIEDMRIGDIISAIQYNLTLANKAWYCGAVPHPEAMTFLRKIGGLCIKAGEIYGMSGRQ